MDKIFIEMKETLMGIFTSWPLKCVMGGAAWLVVELAHMKHVQVFGVFVLLVAYDLVSKWAAIAYQMLVERGAKEEDIYLLDKYCAIPLAFQQGLIGSRYMKKGLVNKLFLYCTATLLAVLFDYIIAKGGYPPFILNLVWIYLGGSEVLSILENMRDGGNRSMGKFLEIIKSQIEKRLGIKV